ncbi:MAG: hypothetical protein ACHQU0_02450 [Candidatus Paceibacteria bacterium]
MSRLTEYKEQPPEVADTNIFSLTPFFSHVSSVLFATLSIIVLASVFPWRGGSVPYWFAPLFYLTVAASVYAFAQGYLGIFRRGLSNWKRWLWSIAILDSIGVTINIVVFGSVTSNAPITFPGSDVLMSAAVFLSFVGFQALYFLVESMLATFVGPDGKRNMENWYFSIYLFMLAMNTGSVIVGLLILWYLHIG